MIKNIQKQTNFNTCALLFMFYKFVKSVFLNVVKILQWREGEPNDHRKSEDCIEMSFDTGQWNDVGCNWLIFNTVCEKPIIRTSK